MSGAEQAPGTTLRHPGSLMQPGSRARALLGSLLLHVVLGVGLWRFDWAPAATDRWPTPARPIELRMAAAIPEPAPRPEPQAPPPPEPPPESEPPRQPEPTLQRTAPDAPATEPVTDETEPGTDDPAREPETETDSEQQRSTTLTESSDASAAGRDAAAREPLVPAGVDMEAVRRDAVARVVATLQERARQRTFSADVPEDTSSATTAADGEPSMDIFEAARAASRRNGVLARGRPRSAFMRNVADLCNELTGGFSILGMVNVCADRRARADLFGHLRPQYLESVPLCTADEELLIQVEETAAGAVGELKCVLVPRAVREEYYGRYDPELAGWLPAEEDAATAQGP